MIKDVEDFFADGCGRCERFASADCSARRWAKGLAELRRICLAAGLAEAAKWGHPCYVHAGRNVAILGAFRGDFRLSFFHAALLEDADGLLEKQGPNTRHPDTIRFADAAEVLAREPAVLRTLREAMGYAEAGVVPPREEGTLELPDELVEALGADPELAEAFHRLTPGRQRSYVLHLGSAKKPETRRARIAKARDRILAGKGANER